MEEKHSLRFADCSFIDSLRIVFNPQMFLFGLHSFLFCFLMYLILHAFRQNMAFPGHSASTDRRGCLTVLFATEPSACEGAASSPRQPLFSDKHSEACPREVLTVQAQQEVKPLPSDSLCDDLSSIFRSLPCSEECPRRGGWGGVGR